MAGSLRVLLVSSERSLLRQGALMLEEFGMHAVACADASSSRAALGSQEIDVLLLDEALLAGDCQHLASWKEASGERHVHVLLLRGATSKLDVHEAFQSGADDFLSLPLSAGELLARLRAAARYVEFERRCERQSWRDPLTGAFTRQAIEDKLSAEFGAGRARKGALLLVEIDFYDACERAHGRAFAQRWLKSVVVAAEQIAVAGQCVARWEAGRFGIWLPDHSLEKAAKYAEKLRTALSDGEVVSPDGTRLTVSIGVAHSQHENGAPGHLIERAEAALADAQRSGRDCVATFGQFEDDHRRWMQQIRSGNPFAACVARDVMTPLVLELSGTDTLLYAQQLLRQTQLDFLPVVDFQGRLAGVLTRERADEAARSSVRQSQPIEPLVDRDVAKLVDSTPFEKVIEHFTCDDHALLFIYGKDNRPRGYIDRERFLHLVHPFDPDVLVSREFASGTEYLVVADFAESAASAMLA